MNVCISSSIVFKLLAVMFFIFSPFDLSPVHAHSQTDSHDLILSQTKDQETNLAYKKVFSVDQKKKMQEKKNTKTKDKQPQATDTDKEVLSPEKKNSDPQKENDKPKRRINPHWLKNRANPLTIS